MVERGTREPMEAAYRGNQCCCTTTTTQKSSSRGPRLERRTIEPDLSAEVRPKGLVRRERCQIEPGIVLEARPIERDGVVEDSVSEVRAPREDPLKVCALPKTTAGEVDITGKVH